MKPRPGSLAVLALLAVAALAQQGREPIRDQDLEPYRKKFLERLSRVQSKEITLEQLVETYGREAAAKAPPRDAAIAAYIHGTLLMRINRINDARTELERAIRLWPPFPPAHLDLAMIAAQAGDMREAKRHIKKALDYDPKYARAMTLQGDFARHDGELDTAKRWYERSLDIRPTVDACLGLAMVYVNLFQNSYDEKQKKEYALGAINCAETMVLLESDKPLAQRDPVVHLQRAQVYRMLGEIEKAVQALEDSYRDQIPEPAKLACLDNLMALYADLNMPDKVENALERMLTHDMLTADRKAEVQTRLEDVRKYGTTAFLIWSARRQLERFKNQGISERDRRAALRALLAFWLHEPFAMDPKLKGMRRQIITTVFKVLTASPPKVTIEILGFLRTDFPDPHLLRILVHFVYPFDDDMRTPDVRVAGVRTIAKVAGRAALPTLLYCLRDEPGEVVREADRALTRICEVRSPVGEDVEPLDAKQIAHARRSWRAHFHSDDGAERMREAIRLLRGYVDMDAQFNRSQTSKPIADHIAQTVLIDADMPWSVWKPAYEFLVDYLNKEFRPVVRRGTPVTQEERPAIVAEIDKFWRGDRLELPPPMPPAPNGAEKTAEEERGEESG